MVVRELVALLGIKTDTASVKKAEAATEGVVSKLAKIAVVAASAAVAIRGVFKFVDLASSANETLNVLNVSFKENAETVINWAKSFADEAGRSEFAMREMAATLGAVLNPMMDGNAKAAAEMSMTLSQLTVDLASMYEMAEDEALIKMRAGITGEAEPLKRFGIVMTEAALAAFALEQGITKSVKSMNISEKTLLRKNFIVEKAKNAMGDAAKTSKGWANASKNLGAKFKDLGTKIGFFFLPVAEKGIAMVIGWMDGFADAVTPMAKFIATIMKVVMWVVRFVSNLPALAKVGLVAIAFLKWGKALKFLLTPMGKIAVLIGLIILIIDDLITWVEGGESVFGKFFDTLGDLAGVPVSEYIKDIIKWFMLLAEDPVAAIEKVIAGLSEFGDALVYAFELLAKTDVAQFFAKWWTAVQAFFGGVIETVMAVLEFIGRAISGKPVEAWNRLVETLKSIWSTAWDDIYAYLKIFIDLVKPIWNSIAEAVKSVFTGIGEWISGWIGSIIDKMSSKLGKFGGWVSGIFGGGGGVSKGGGAAPSHAAVPPGRGGMVNNQKTDIKIDIKATPGMNEERLASEVSTQMRNELERRDRAAMKSFSTAG